MGAFKRLMDMVVAAVALAALSPVLLMIAAVVRGTSPGPALFRQRRLGRFGVPFRIVKFRTMCEGCPDLRNADGSTFSSDTDPRITAVGRFLRQTSLDELPQLWNVLRGEMSLVGPRPDLADQLRFYEPEEKRRLLVRPGITGLAQISGRNSLDWKSRKQLDLRYVDNLSLSMDLWILARTVPYVLLRRGINQKEEQCPQ